MKKVFQCVSIFAVLLLTGCTAIDAVTGQKTRNFYSLQEDVKLGSQVYGQTIDAMRKQGVPVNADRARVGQLQQMVKRIGAVSDLPDLPYEVVLIQTNVVNALAAPGGKIMVYEGLWDPKKGLARDEDEIAAVIAHEIAHVNARHSTEAMTRAMPANLITTFGLAFTAGTKYEQVAQVAATAGMFWHNGMYMTRYSRENETEADSIGMMYMAKAGYDPRAAVRIWERAAQHRTGQDPAASIFSTHPADNVRLQNLRARLPEALRVYQNR